MWNTDCIIVTGRQHYRAPDEIQYECSFEDLTCRWGLKWPIDLKGLRQLACYSLLKTLLWDRYRWLAQYSFLNMLNLNKSIWKYCMNNYRIHTVQVSIEGSRIDPFQFPWCHFASSIIIFNMIIVIRLFIM